MIDQNLPTPEQLELHRGRLVRLCATITGDPDAADDLAQEALIAAWRHVQTLRSPESLSAWLSGIARNQSLRWLRSTARRPAELRIEHHSNVADVWVVLGCMLLVGVPVIAWLSTQQMLMQVGAPDELRGRVFGAYGTTNAVMLLIGTGSASALGDIVGIVPLMNLAAALYVLAGGIALAAVPAAITSHAAPAARET